ncbi:MAG TPA: polyphosphate kinase 2 family protein [Puia sp.]|nr:polyphosphate kinase 2 family protein [Puia sp.]
MKSKIGERLSDIPELSKKEIVQRAKDFSKQFRIKDGSEFRLKDFDPKEDGGLGDEDKPLAKQTLQMGVEALSALQEVLYAYDKWAVLLIFQAMDAAGKDGAIRHVMSGVNPQGCQVTSYKAPSPEELDHDYMWRCTKNLPERGRIGIFNRSYYEEVLAVRVHKEFLQNQKIPKELITKDIWDDRLKDIRNFEAYLNRNGIVVCKFFLNLSKKEQKKRFLDRINNPDKNWKFSASDAKERKFWDEYMDAYEQLIRETATKDSPWYVVPADNKAFSRVVVASAIIHTMDSLDMEYPKLSKEKLEELNTIKEDLMSEK